MTDSIIAWLPLVLEIVASVGVIGLIVLFFAAPAIFAVVIEGLQAFFKAILATRLGCALLAAAIAALAADQYRGRMAAEECRVRIEDRDAAAARAAKQRDKDQSRLADFDAQQRLEDLEKQFRTDQETIDALRAVDQTCHPLTADQLR